MSIRLSPQKEHDIQATYFRILEWNVAKFPYLRFIFAIPNGGHRHIAVARKMKAEGVKRGVPDIFVPISNKYNGLYLETKTDKGTQTKEQKEFEAFLISQGYSYCLCRSTDELITATEQYLQITLNK